MNGDIDELLNGCDKSCGVDPNVLYMPRNECYQIRMNFKNSTNNEFRDVYNEIKDCNEKSDRKFEKIDQKMDNIYAQQGKISTRLLLVFAAIISGIITGIVLYALP